MARTLMDDYFDLCNNNKYMALSERAIYGNPWSLGSGQVIMNKFLMMIKEIITLLIMKYFHNLFHQL